jgi:hypothetical protein
MRDPTFPTFPAVPTGPTVKIVTTGFRRLPYADEKGFYATLADFVVQDWWNGDGEGYRSELSQTVMSFVRTSDMPGWVRDWLIVGLTEMAPLRKRTRKPSFRRRNTLIRCVAARDPLLAGYSNTRNPGSSEPSRASLISDALCRLGAPLAEKTIGNILTAEIETPDLLVIASNERWYAYEVTRQLREAGITRPDMEELLQTLVNPRADRLRIPPLKLTAPLVKLPR